MTFQKKILLIDHDPVATRPLRQELEQTGRFLLREEHDERTALHAAQWFGPDLILLNFMTAGDDAQALASETNANTPVLCIGQLGGDGEVASAGVVDGYRFFAGPLPAAEFVREIEELLFAS